MIPIIEDHIYSLIEDKINYLKSNPDIISSIVATKDTESEKLKQYIINTPFRIIKGYPRTPAELPCICIILSKEDETQDSLGDASEDVDMNILDHTQECEVISAPGALLTVPYIQVDLKPIHEVSQIVHNELGTILDKSKYSIINPESGIIAIYDNNYKHADTVTVSYSYVSTSEVYNEVMYDADYKIEVWTSNGDLTVKLYHILKWILLSSRDYLVTDVKLHRQKLGGGDFEPVPGYFPEFVYRRGLTFWCQFITSTPMEEVSYISAIEQNETISFDPTIGGDNNG